MTTTSSVLSATIVAIAVAAAPLSAQRLISVSSTPGSAIAFELDRTTATPTQLGAMSPAAAIPAALAYDMNTGRLFMSGTGTDSVYVVDVTNWEGHLIGAYGNAAIIMHGLEWDSSTGTLYGMSTHNSGLYTIDTATGAATLVGTTGLPVSSAAGLNLGYDLITDTMYMVSTATDSLYTIDRATGAATLVGPMTGTTNVSSLAFCLADLSFYGVDNLSDVLYRIDASTGAATAVGSVGSTNMIGLVWIDGAGRLAREAHACGPTTILPVGHPAPGSTTTFTLGGTTGLPLVGFGLSSATQPFCGCTIGHEWLAVAGGTTVSLAIPGGSWLIGRAARAGRRPVRGRRLCVAAVHRHRHDPPADRVTPAGASARHRPRR
ncbi:MAG: hypothetical protein U1E73_01185 [Planctomycetota bacterium]